MPKELYSIESALGTKNYDAVVGGIDSNYFYHSYNFYYQLKYPLQNVSKITFKTVEMPLGLSAPNNIRYNNDTQILTLLYTISTNTNIARTVNITPGSYSTTSALMMAINTAITAAALTGSPTRTFATSTNSKTGYSHCSITHNCTSLTIYSSSLTINLLGLGSSNITSAAPISGTYPINVFAIDSMYYLIITNLPVMNNEFPYTFKIPLNNFVNSIAYYNDSKENQSIYFNSSPFILDKLNFVVVDALNRSLTGYFNSSIPLEIEYDNNVPKEQFLNFNK